MTPDEVRMLDNRKALLFIRGELPVCDDKYDILTHPLVSRTPDGGGLPYAHGGTEQAVASIRVDGWRWGPARRAIEQTILAHHMRYRGGKRKAARDIP